jgi:hypothetical protein
MSGEGKSEGDGSSWGWGTSSDWGMGDMDITASLNSLAEQANQIDLTAAANYAAEQASLAAEQAAEQASAFDVSAAASYAAEQAQLAAEQAAEQASQMAKELESLDAGHPPSTGHGLDWMSGESGDPDAETGAETTAAEPSAAGAR